MLSSNASDYKPYFTIHSYCIHFNLLHHCDRNISLTFAVLTVFYFRSFFICKPFSLPIKFCFKKKLPGCSSSSQISFQCRPQHNCFQLYNILPKYYFGIQLESQNPPHKHTATRLWFWFVTTETSTQSDGCRVAAMLVLAGKRPTLRSSDSQTHTNTQAHTLFLSLRLSRQGGWVGSMCVCVCVAV